MREWLMADGMTEWVNDGDRGRVLIEEKNESCVCDCVRGASGLSHQCLIVFVSNCNSIGLPVAPLG